jgi:hypothetical protein
VNIRIPWVGLIGVCLLIIGLVLGFRRLAQYYPGLVILAGCLALAVCLMVNEAAATRPDRKVREVSSDIPEVGEDNPSA